MKLQDIFGRLPGRLLGVSTLVLLLGMAIYLHGFVQTLPYQLEPDEPNVWIFAHTLNTAGHFRNLYPPLRIVELALEQRLLALITPPGQLAQPVYYVTGRYFSTLYGMLLLALAYQAGRQLHSRAAGLAAMLFLIAQPDALSLAKVMRVDIFAGLFGMLTLLLAFRAFRKDRRWLVAASLGVGVLAFLGKYSMLPILIVPGLLFILLFPRRPWLRAALAVMAVILVTGGLYVFFNPPELVRPLLEFTRMTREVYEREQPFQLALLVPNWSRLMTSLGRVYFWGVVIGLPIAAFLWPREPLRRRQWLLLAFAAAMIVGAYLWLAIFAINRPRDSLVIILGFALFWGATLAMLARRRAYLSALAAFALLIPRLVVGWQHGTELRQPDTRAMTADWFITNVPEGTHIAVEYDRVEFDRGYGGFPSDKIFFAEIITSVYDDTLEGFARRGIEYLVADERNIYRGGFYDDETDDSAFLNSVELVLDLDHSGAADWQGPRRLIFRIPPIQQNPMHIFLGDSIIFRGYDLPSTTVAHGETLDLVLYWGGLRETAADYIVFAHVLTPDGGTLAAQHDGQPGDALHRTYDWWPGYFDWDEWPIEIPPDTPPGEYILSIGMYDSMTQERLSAYDDEGTRLGDRVLLTAITIVAEH